MNRLYIILLLVCYWGCTNAQKQRGYPCLVMSLGVEASHLLPSNTWTPNDSYGFRQGMGLGLQSEYRFNTSHSVVVRTAYQRWGVQRKYFDGNGTLSQKAGTALSVVPVGIGYKHRFNRLFYLMPELNLAFQNGIQTDTFSNTIKNRNTSIGLGFSVGFEKTRHSHYYDMSLNYGYLSSAFGINSAWQYLSVRLTAGWKTGALRRVPNKCYYN